MMTRIVKLREFTNTWMSDFSPMCLMVLQENIYRSLNCNIEFNGVDGFEVIGHQQGKNHQIQTMERAKL